MGPLLVKMFSLVVFSLAFAASVLGQDDGIRCGECIMEMHRFGGIIHANGEALAQYLAENYCPTIEEEHQEGCPAHLAHPDMLGAVVHRFISSDEGARHMCTTMKNLKNINKRFIIPSFIGSFCLNNIFEYFHSN